MLLCPKRCLAVQVWANKAEWPNMLQHSLANIVQFIFQVVTLSKRSRLPTPATTPRTTRRFSKSWIASTSKATSSTSRSSKRRSSSCRASQRKAPTPTTPSSTPEIKVRQFLGYFCWRYFFRTWKCCHRQFLQKKMNESKFKRVLPSSQEPKSELNFRKARKESPKCVLNPEVSSGIILSISNLKTHFLK